MQDPKLDIIGSIKLEKQLQVFVSVYLSLLMLVLIFVLVKISMTSELQQALIIILGLITIVTVDAFKKALGDSSSLLTNEFKQIIVQDGASYVDGNVEAIHKPNQVQGHYVTRGSINYGNEIKQNLAEAAADIQDLLKQLEKSNPSATEEEKIAYVNEEIEPEVKSRVAKLLKDGGDLALDSVAELELEKRSNSSKLIASIIRGFLQSL